MKVALNIFYVLIVFLFCTMEVIAKATPPAPTGKINNGPAPPPPPGLSIDKGVAVLVIVALLYGIYCIYCHRKNVKISI